MVAKVAEARAYLQNNSHDADEYQYIEQLKNFVRDLCCIVETQDSQIAAVRQDWHKAIQIANSKPVSCKSNQCEENWAYQSTAWKILYNSLINTELGLETLKGTSNEPQKT